MVDFLDWFHDLEGTGFYEIALPFLLVFAVVFAVLEKIQLFGGNKKQINLVIAAIAGLLMLRNDLFVEFMNDILARFSVVLIVLLAFLILIGMLGSKVENWTKGLFTLVVVLSLAAGIVILSERMGYYDITGTSDIGDFFDEYSTAIWIIVIIGILAAVVIFSNEGKTGRTLDQAFGKPGGGTS